METQLVLCAYCCTPLKDGEQICSQCGGNRDNDPGVEMSEQEFLNEDREPCNYCGQPIISFAPVCFACKRRQSDGSVFNNSQHGK